MKTRGPKSNSSELLCLSWLPATWPHPNDATHKIWSRLANWLQRYSSSNVWNFRHSRASNSKMSGLIRPKIDRAFMPVLVTSNFDDDSIKNEWTSIETPFSRYKSIGNLFRRSRAANSVASGLIWPKFELVRDFMHVLVTCKYKKDRIKTTEKRWRNRFPLYKSMGTFCCHGYQSFDPICPKTVCSLSPTQVMLHIKFDQDWPTGFRDMKVWTTTDDGPLVYYKLTLRAFGSGELKKRTISVTAFHSTLPLSISSGLRNRYEKMPYLCIMKKGRSPKTQPLYN